KYGNSLAKYPAGDGNGNASRPQCATGYLQSVSIFGLVPNRPGLYPSGWVQRLIGRMPLPNDFTNCGPSFNPATSVIAATLAPSCDGLNVAGYRWVRRVQGQDTSVGDGQDTKRDQYNARIDHNCSQKHKRYSRLTSAQ